MEEFGIQPRLGHQFLHQGAGLRDAALTSYRRALTLDPMFEAVTKRAGELTMQSQKKPGI